MNFADRHIGKRLLNVLFLTVGNSRKIQSNVKDEATVDAHLHAWVSPLSSYVAWQCEKPPTIGQQRELDPTLSFVAIAQGGVTAA